VPAAPRVPTDPVGALHAGNAAAGVTLDSRTARPTWDGDPLDEGYALDVLRPDNGPRLVAPPPRGPVAAVSQPDATAPAATAAAWDDGWTMEPIGMEARWGRR
jgi:hypothetical protein